VPGDKVGTFAYADSVRTLADFPQTHQTLDSVVTGHPGSSFLETNLFDALITMLDRMRPAEGRKAVLLISTGIDTFSHATFDQVLAAVQRSGTPFTLSVWPASWSAASSDRLARSPRLTGRAQGTVEDARPKPGGRAYLRDTELDIPAIYDDMMEHLRVRYVLTYASPTVDERANVRVELVEPRTGAPLRITDPSGRRITPHVTVGREGR